MFGQMKEQAAEPHRGRNLGTMYLIGALISGVVFVVYLIPAAPLFIHVFLPFPELQDTNHWVGRVQIQPRQVQGSRISIERQFILTSTGRHEFSCGYLGDRYGCPEYQVMNGAVGEVWYSRTHGALQWRLVIAEGFRKGREERSDIAGWKTHYQANFRYGRYFGRLLVALAPLGVAVWQIRRYRQLRK